MKHLLSLLLLLLLMTACGTERHVPRHPTVTPKASKAQREAQDRLSSQFGGPNFHRPNQFKRNHFKNGFSVR